MGAFEDANELGILQVGRLPSWRQQAGATGAPGDSNDGVYLDNAVVALFDVALRANPSFREANVTIATLDLTATYTITIDGNAAAYDAAAAGAADAADVIQGISDAINAAPAVSAIVTSIAQDLDGDGDVDNVRIRGDAEADYSITVAATGSGDLDCEADASSCELRLFATMRGSKYDSSHEDPSATGWRLINAATYTVDYRGIVERIVVAGLNRLYVEVDSVAGHASDSGATYQPSVSIGPAVLE
jgi:hypothetical protein